MYVGTVAIQARALLVATRQADLRDVPHSKDLLLLADALNRNGWWQEEIDEFGSLLVDSLAAAATREQVNALLTVRDRYVAWTTSPFAKEEVA